MSKFYVYLITNISSNKKYVGSRMTYKGKPEEDTYMGSSKYLNEDYKKYGYENFSKKILGFYSNKKDLLKAETKYILEFDTLNPRGYNKNLPTDFLKFHRGGCPLSEQAKEKISKGLKLAYKEGRKQKPKYSGNNHPMYGKNHTEESKIKIGKAGKGRILSNETKKKMSQSSVGIKKTNEHRKNISKGRKGIIFSNEHRKNISKSHIGVINEISDSGRKILSETIFAINKRKIECPYCKNRFNPGNYGRYHGEKCKLKFQS